MNKLGQTLWMTGLFEGEGCISTTRRVRLILKMTDEDVVRQFHSIAGVGTVVADARSKRNYKHKDCWTWSCSFGADCDTVLRRMLPYMGKRRWAKATEALAAISRQQQQRRRDATTCVHGHDLSGDGIYVSPTDGKRSCRTCRRLRSRSAQR